MKELSFNEMEVLEGGDAETWCGVAIGVTIVGAVGVTLITGGIGAIVAGGLLGGGAGGTVMGCGTAVAEKLGIPKF